MIRFFFLFMFSERNTLTAAFYYVFGTEPRFYRVYGIYDANADDASFIRKPRILLLVSAVSRSTR